MMHNVNKTSILEFIRNKGPVSRSTIASALGLSLSSVVHITEELLKSDFVCAAEGSGQSGGRRIPLFKMDEENNLCISIDLGGTKIYAVLMDLSGKVLKAKEIVNHNLKGEEAYCLICDIIRELLAFWEKTKKKLLGISIGVPGSIDKTNSVVQWAPSLDWRDFALKQRLENDFHMEVEIANDLNLGALGEAWFGQGQNMSEFVFISIGTGLAGGMVIGHSVYAGAHNMAGEIGYSIFDKECLKKDYPGFGPLEMIASGMGISLRAKEHLESILGEEELKKVTGRYAFEACRKGEKWAVEIIDDMADYLSMAIVSICAMIDPEAIILGGGISNSADVFLDRIKENLQYTNSNNIPLLISNIAKNVTVLGAMIKLFHRKSNFAAIQYSV